jgi:hypothetical protein
VDLGNVVVFMAALDFGSWPSMGDRVYILSTEEVKPIASLPREILIWGASLSMDN